MSFASGLAELTCAPRSTVMARTDLMMETIKMSSEAIKAIKRSARADQLWAAIIKMSSEAIKAIKIGARGPALGGCVVKPLSILGAQRLEVLHPWHRSAM